MRERWVPAADYYRERRMSAFAMGGLEAMEGAASEIVLDLRFGKLRARGRRLTWRKLPKEQACDLIAGGDEEPVLGHVEEIPTTFWDDLIWHGGDECFEISFFRLARGYERPDGGWEETEVWDEVEILDAGARPRGGRPPVYDWDAFEAEALRLLEEEGGFGPGWRQADLERLMADWCQQQWGIRPAESAIRKHVKRAVEAFERARRRA